MSNPHSSYWVMAIGALSSAIPCFYLGWTLFNVWRDPMSVDDGSWVRFGVGLLVLEFILLHSGAFVSAMLATKEDWQSKLKLLLVLFVFYSLTVWGFATSLQSPALLWIFAGVSAGRLVTAYTGGMSANSQPGSMSARSALGIMLYLLVGFGSVFIAVPEWGIDSAILGEVYPNRGGGLWEREPQRAIAAGAAYFFLLGLAELFVLGPFNKRSVQEHFGEHGEE
ncbi:MAG: hypothetical protein MI746_06850 [Pseudomonadales bacterium]|nr:hypothetical protein [Pseudomonadales bacterium]